MKYSILKGLKSICRRAAVTSALTLLLLPALSVSGANITIDFRQFNLESPDNQFFTSEEVLDFLDTQESTSGMISAIPYCEGVYGFTKGLGQYEFRYGTTEGAIFIRATDPDNGEDNGGISFIVSPKYRHRNTSLNIFAYRDQNINSSDAIDVNFEVSLNGGDSKLTSITKEDKNNFFPITLNINPAGEIIKDLSLRFKNPCRKKDGSLPQQYENYYIALTRLVLAYNETNDNPQQVSKWEFSEGEYEAFLNSSDELELPTLLTEPAESADMAEYSSSDPEVAEIRDGKITIKKAGSTTITASLPENPLFLESDTYSPASYLLTVKDNQQTGVESLMNEDSSTNTLYDLHGNIVNANPLPGIYIRKSSSGTEKVVIR